MARGAIRRIRDQNLTSEDTCAGRYPSPIGFSCARGKVPRWAPASAGACGEACLYPTNTASPAHAEVSCRNYAEPAARDSGMRRRGGERRLCHPGKSDRIYPGASTRIAPSLYWVPDICSRKFRDDRIGSLVPSSCTNSRTGLRHPGIHHSSSARRSRGAAGAVALRLEFVMATDWSVTARRAGQEFRRAPSRGPMVPGLRYRCHANDSTVLLTRMAHPGRFNSRATGRGGFPTCLRKPTLA